MKKNIVIILLSGIIVSLMMSSYIKKLPDNPTAFWGTIPCGNAKCMIENFKTNPNVTPAEMEKISIPKSVLKTIVGNSDNNTNIDFYFAAYNNAAAESYLLAHPNQLGMSGPLNKNDIINKSTVILGYTESNVDKFSNVGNICPPPADCERKILNSCNCEN